MGARRIYARVCMYVWLECIEWAVRWWSSPGDRSGPLPASPIVTEFVIFLERPRASEGKVDERKRRIPWSKHRAGAWPLHHAQIRDLGHDGGS